MGPVTVSPGRPTQRSTPRGPCASAGSLYPTLPPHTHCSRPLRHAHTHAPSPRRAPPERRRTRSPSWCPPIVWGHGAYLEIQHIQLQFFCVSMVRVPHSVHNLNESGNTPSRRKVSAKQRHRTTPDSESSADRGSILRCTGATSSCSARAALASWTCT